MTDKTQMTGLRQQLAEAREGWGAEKLKRVEYGELLEQLEQERDELKQQLLASEACMERIRDNILNCRGPLEGFEFDNDALNAVLSIIDEEPPQTALSEALKPVREARLCIQMVIAKDEQALEQLGEVGKMVDRSSINMLKDALSELDKLCPPTKAEGQ